MASSSNKQEIVKFLGSEWKKETYRSQLNGKRFYFTEGTECWKITADEVKTISTLRCSHEEADTRMVLHAEFSEALIVDTDDDTDRVTMS